MAAPVSYQNEVMAVLAKAGCNMGTCHGNANGKGGFKISLRGESPAGDWKVIARNELGRRLNLIEPDESLLLKKATAQIPHEGRRRFEVDSWEYRILRQWIAEGAKNDTGQAPKLTALEVAPTHRTLYAPDNQIQITAKARFADGSERDVTSQAVYEPSNNLLEVTPLGQVTFNKPGETTVLVRFLNRQEPVRLAFVPERVGFAWSPPTTQGMIDTMIFGKLKKLRINPSPVADDTVFMRRAYLDLIGLLPTENEAREFVTDSDPAKRKKLVNRLMEREEFAEFWALKWADLLNVEVRTLDPKGVQLFHGWIRDRIADNTPMDEFARSIISARGSTYTNPAANYFRAIRKPQELAEATAQVFLGRRLQCAQCHNHPFDRWTQGDYYDWASAFAKIDYKLLKNIRRDGLDKHEFNGEQVVYMKSNGSVKNPKTGKAAPARFLSAGQPVPGGDDPLREMAKWMTAPDNPFFARAQANRIWFHLMGRGLVNPIDDFRPTNPATHPVLLDLLATEFIASGYDLRHMIRLITSSATYQLASEPNATNAGDEINYSHAIPRRLSAEQLLDTQAQVADAPLPIRDHPPGTRVVQVANTIKEKRRRSKDDIVDVVLEAFGKPQRLLNCECERSDETTLAQAFQMISGPVLNGLLTGKANRLERLAKADQPAQQTLESLYWTALSRPPTATELEAGLQHLAKAETTEAKRGQLEDIAWALMNSKEFILRR